MNSDFCLCIVNSCDFTVHAQKKKKKKTTEHRRAKCAIQTGTFLDFFLAEIPLKKSFFEEAKPKS